MNDNITRAAELIKKSRHSTVFTGAGISAESGIPPFRGKDGFIKAVITQNIDNLHLEAGRQGEIMPLLLRKISGE
jgi:NAD-dependent SIR2 family protein deacetylase